MIWIAPKVVLAAMMSLSATARASFYDGNQLYANCFADAPALCLGYIVGVADALAAM